MMVRTHSGGVLVQAHRCQFSTGSHIYSQPRTRVQILAANKLEIGLETYLPPAVRLDAGAKCAIADSFITPT